MKCRDFRAALTREDKLPNLNRSRENRARAASRPEAPPPIRQSPSQARASFRSSHHRRFQEFECAFLICVQARLYAQRYRKHGPNGMADRRTKNDRDAEWPQNSRADFPYGWGCRNGRLTFRTVPQPTPAPAFHFTGLFQI